MANDCRQDCSPVKCNGILEIERANMPGIHEFGQGLVRPGREMLFTAVDAETKYKAKNVIDTAVYRGGDAVSERSLDVAQRNPG